MKALWFIPAAESQLTFRFPAFLGDSPELTETINKINTFLINGD